MGWMKYSYIVFFTAFIYVFIFLNPYFTFFDKSASEVNTPVNVDNLAFDPIPEATNKQGSKSEDELWRMVFKKHPYPKKPKMYKRPPALDPNSMKRFQKLMKDWERETGKSFLNDHWTMQKHKDEDNPLVTNRFNLRPLDPQRAYYYDYSRPRDEDIHLSHTDIKETITGKVVINTIYYATDSEMAQCSTIKKENARRKSKYSDEYCLKKYGPFMTSNDAKYSQFNKECGATVEPKWCGYGGRGVTLTSKREVNRNSAGSCNIHDGERLDQNKRKKLVTSAREVICGEIWRDFATKIYNNTDPQKFITLNPFYSMKEYLNEELEAAKAAYEVAVQEQIDKRVNYYLKLKAEHGVQ